MDNPKTSTKTDSEKTSDNYVSLKAAISTHSKLRLKAICAVKGIKMQDVLGELINDYIDKNKKAIGE